jgi:chromosome transmission fidelity protein 18
MPPASRTLLWTEKYRATRYTDLVGDERTHRSVLGWLKSWDPIVFPATARQKKQQQQQQQQRQQQPAMALGPFANRGGEARAVHRKILLLAGPPGLGKTTLAHVCARHAGYEVVEINASDERSRDVVKGRIRECVGSQNVRAVTAATSMTSATAMKRPVYTANRKAATATDAGRPVCVIVDEVDGAYGGSSSSGDGGFISALMELLALDQKNAAAQQQQQQQQPRTAVGALAGARKKKGGRRGDNFRLSRPIILVCNDAYHPSLRPLRQSALAEIVHARRPLLSQVAARVQTIFRQEGYACDGDGVRKLCEAAWGCASSQRNAPGSLSSFFAGHAEGDLRGVLVVAEWVAGKLRAASSSLSSLSGASAACARLTRHWVERHVLGELAHGGGAARGLGRGGAKEAVERVFLEGAGYQNSASSAHTGGAAGVAADVTAAGAVVGVAELRKRYAMRRLNELVESCGEVDRVITGIFC